MNTGFIQKINAIYEKLGAIDTANSSFNQEIIDILLELKDLDLELIAQDINKGTFLGNRKIDVNLALNMQGITEDLIKNDTDAGEAIWTDNSKTVLYDSCTALFKDGVEITIPFVFDGNPVTLSTHSDLLLQLDNNTQFKAKLENTSMSAFPAAVVGEFVRFYDVVGQASNLDRITLNAVSGQYIEQNPNYFWAKSTSAVETLSMRGGDIIKLGNEIDNIIELVSKISEVIDIQEKLPELVGETGDVTIYNKLAELQAIYTKLSNIVSVSQKLPAIENVSLNETNINKVASQELTLQEIVNNLAAIQSASANAESAEDSKDLALSYVEQLTGLTVTVVTLASGQSATQSYNSSTNTLTLGIPQGLKGDRGEAFNIDARGNLVSRDAYDGAATGFSYLSTDTNPTYVYFKKTDAVGDWTDGIAFGKGDKGERGYGVSNISKTNTTGNIDTYTITIENGDEYTFTVTNSDVSSINGKTGAVVLGKADIGLGNVNNTSDLNKPISTAVQQALDELEDSIASSTQIVKPTIVSPTNGTTDFMGEVVLSEFSTSKTYIGEQDYVKWLATNQDGTTTYDSYEGTSNLSSWTPNIGLPLTDVYVKAIVGSDRHISLESDPIMFTTPDIYVETPTMTITGETLDVPETPTITLSAFSVYNGTDTHESSSYKITRTSDNVVVHENLADTTNLLSYTVPSSILETNTEYLFEAWQTGVTYGNSTSVSKTVTTKSNFRTTFGRIWNTTDDTYKRFKDGVATLSAATELEFSSWLSPSARRVNDDDTDTPSDLTTELDTNTSLPFATMSRKVVTNTGTVSNFDHVTAPVATEQIMTQIEKTYYIHALVVADGKEYDIELVSKEPFNIDVVNDLGLTNVTNISCFNPIAGISSGTVAGNVISSALHPAFIWHNDDEADYTYVGSFPSISGRSTFGSKATSDITRATARTQNSGFGTNFNQHDFWNQSFIQLLAYIERGSNYLEGSGTKWDGYARSGLSTGDVQNTGLTLSLENKTGVIKDGSNYVIANSYRGIENYHSNLRIWVDGINLNGGVVHLAKAGSSYADDTDASPYFDSGYTTATATIDIDKWLAGTFIPNPVGGGDSTTQVTDKAYGSASGWRVLSSGGSLNAPAYSGLSYWYGNYTSTAQNWIIVSRSSFRKFLA